MEKILIIIGKLTNFDAETEISKYHYFIYLLR